MCVYTATMLQELKFQLSTAILTVLTIAAATAAVINYQQNHLFHLPDDGVVWRDRSGAVVAEKVIPHGPGDNAGIRVNDVLESVQGVPVHTSSDVSRLLASGGAWKEAAYVYRRSGVDVKATVYVGEVSRGVAAFVSIPRRRLLPRDRSFYLFPPRQRVQGPAFLHLLSGFVYFLLLPLDG